MDLDGDFISTDIRYREKTCNNKKDAAIPANNGARKKVGDTKSVSNKVQVDKAKCVEVEKVKGAECSVEVPKLEDGATDSGGASTECSTAGGGANIECGGASIEVEKGEKSKGSVDAIPKDESGVSVECVKQMSKEKIRRIGQHLSGSKGKCSVVLFCWIIIVV